MRDTVNAQIVDFGELNGQEYDADADAWDPASVSSTTNAPFMLGLYYDAGSHDRWEESETDHTAVPGSPAHALDGNHGLATGDYVVTNPFETGQGREYSGPDSATLLYESSRWRIKIGSTVYYESSTTGEENPQGNFFYEDEVTTLGGDDSEYRSQLAVLGSPPPSFSVKRLGAIAEGRSNRKNCNINSSAHYLMIQALGRPIILESVAVHIEDGGPNLKNMQTVVT